MTPPLSIITPSFNQSKYLERTIRSVLAQDIPDLEYIIVDGGSTDGSLEIIQRYADKLASWVSEPDAGQTDALNKGFSRAHGSVLAWINSDDTYNAGAVRAALKVLSERPEIAVVYSDCNYIDEQDLAIGRFPAAQTDYRRLRRGYVHIPQQTMFFRAEYWKQIGPLDPSLRFAMDYDLWTRIAARAPFLYVQGQTWANFRIHAAGKTTAHDDLCWPEMLRVHYRDGGGLFSAIVAKYYVRRIIGPLWKWRITKSAGVRT